MNLKKDFFNRFLFFSIIISIYLTGWFIQDNLVFNSDVSWLIHAASWLLQGASYANHFFESNPPLILYLYLPVLLFTKIFAMDQVIALKLYVYIIASVSLFICHILLKRIFPLQAFIRCYLLIVLTCIFLIFPLNEFGQREHILVLLTFPYFLLMGCYLEKSDSTSNVLKFLIGILAGLGFAIKPYFYLPFFLVETYYGFKKKSWKKIIRIETLSIAIIALIYLTFIFIRHRDYLTVILPFIIHSYYPSYQISFKSLLRLDSSLFFYSTIILFWINYQKNTYKQFSIILLLALIGFYGAFLFQQMGWFYHALPFYSFGIVIVSYLFCIMLINPINRMALVYAIVVLAYLTWKLNFIALDGIFTPSIFFIYFINVFALTLFIAAKNSGISLFFRLTLFSFITIFFLQHIYHHAFVLSVLMFFLCFFVLIPVQTQQKFHYLVVSAVGLIAFVFPFHQYATLYNGSIYYKKMYVDLVEAMKPYRNKRVYYFTTNSELTFPLVYYTKQKYVSRLWSLAYPPLSQENSSALNFYIKNIVADFNQYQPEFVFVDIRTKGNYIFSVPPNFLLLFSSNNAFRKVWKQYDYVTTINNPPLYKFAIYKAISIS